MSLYGAAAAAAGQCETELDILVGYMQIHTLNKFALATELGPNTVSLLEVVLYSEKCRCHEVKATTEAQANCKPERPVHN